MGNSSSHRSKVELLISGVTCEKEGKGAEERPTLASLASPCIGTGTLLAESSL